MKYIRYLYIRFLIFNPKPMLDIEKMSDEQLLDCLGSFNSGQLHIVCEEDAEREGATIVMRLEEIVFERLESALGSDIRDGEEKADAFLASAVEVMDIGSLFSFIGTLEEV